MSRKAAILGLGGHSFIAQLGNDPPASFEEQCAVVAACLDAGIQLIDTTYYQERVALRQVLRALGRRDEAEIAAWNFFRQPGREDDLVGPTPYAPHHIDVMLEELQTDHIDLLVIHTHENAEELRRELQLAERWQAQGKVRSVALGMVEAAHLRALGTDHPITHVLAPYNAFTQGATAVFAQAREQGLRTIALSPFVRGWKLDEIDEDPATVAPILLRWAAFSDHVDRVVVAMRRREWVAANVRALRQGPLTAAENARLAAWIGRSRGA